MYDAYIYTPQSLQHIFGYSKLNQTNTAMRSTAVAYFISHLLLMKKKFLINFINWFERNSGAENVVKTSLFAIQLKFFRRLHFN